MSDTTIKQLAELIGTPVETFLQQLKDAGMEVSSADDTITNMQKLKLLEFIRIGQNTSTSANKSSGKISLKRRSTSEIDVSNSHGKNSVSVEVRRKKSFSRPAIIKEEESETGNPAGIEADGEEVSIMDPFDPESISIDQKSVPMDTLIRRLEQNSINLTPSFQRNEVWIDMNRSRLIESIMLKIPLPMFYVASDEEGNWEVVDGLQRLSTIRNFILGNDEGKELVLGDLEFLGERLDGKTFTQIKEDSSNQRLVNTILETELRFTIINPGTPEIVKRNIFKRINTGGLPLSSQEIRHALYQGKATDLLIKFEESNEFREATSGTVNDSRMGARELVLYFLSFLIFPRVGYKSNIDDWLSNTLQVINLMPELDQNRLQKIYKDKEIPNIRYRSIDQLKPKFKLAMKRSKILFGEHAFRKSLLEGDRRTPINKALFEIWSNILCGLSEEDFSLLIKYRGNLFNYYSVLLRGEQNKDGGELPTTSDADKANYYNQLFFNKKTNWDVSDILDLSLEELDDKDKIWYRSLLNGVALDAAISRNASDAQNVVKRYDLISNMVNNYLKELKDA